MSKYARKLAEKFALKKLCIEVNLDQNFEDILQEIKTNGLINGLTPLHKDFDESDAVEALASDLEKLLIEYEDYILRKLSAGKVNDLLDKIGKQITEKIKTARGAKNDAST